MKNHASKLPMIYLPTLVTLNEQEKKELDTLNGLDDACAEINKAIDLGVQVRQIFAFEPYFDVTQATFTN